VEQVTGQKKKTLEKCAPIKVSVCDQMIAESFCTTKLKPLKNLLSCFSAMAVQILKLDF